MIDLLTERSLRKGSTLTGLNGTPDCDDASPRKKAPLLKLDAVRTHDSRLRTPVVIATATRHYLKPELLLEYCAPELACTLWGAMVRRGYPAEG